MINTAFPVPSLFPERNTSQEHFDRIASIIRLPEVHTLVYVDYGLKYPRFSFYLEDPKIVCPALERDRDEDEDDYDDRYEREMNEFVNQRCRSCNYYFDSKQLEDKDDDGNVVESIVHSACSCYRDGIYSIEVSSDGGSQCLAGHTLPVRHDEDEDEDEDSQDRETSTHVYRGGRCWEKTTVPSAPLYFSLDYYENYAFNIYEVMCGVGFAKKISAFPANKSDEYIYVLSPMWRALNTYGDGPSRICWGDDGNGPECADIVTFYAMYYSGRFNNDLEQFEDYGNSIDSCLSLEGDINSYVDMLDRSDDENEYKSVAEKMREELGDSVNYLGTNEEERFIVSCDAWEKKANALLVVDKKVSPNLFYKVYLSGIPCPIKNILNRPIAVYPLFQYRYVNPENPDQYIDGYVTEQNAAGDAWFFVQDYDLARARNSMDIGDLSPKEYDSFYKIIRYNASKANLSVSFGLIKP